MLLLRCVIPRRRATFANLQTTFHIVKTTANFSTKVEFLARKATLCARMRP